MNSEERVMNALAHKPIDRVPTFEWEISRKLIEAMTPGADMAEFIERMDIDGIVVHQKYKKDFIDEVTYRDEWGVTKKITAEETDITADGPVKEPEDLEGYTPPDPCAPYRLDAVKEALDRFKGKRAVILHLNDVFSLPSRIMPFEEFLMAINTEPEMVDKLIGIVVDYNIKVAKRAWDLGLRIVMTGDDYCYTRGPMFSPKAFREIFFPWYKKVMRAYKDMGFMVIKHCDGDVMSLIDMIVDPETGIDCYDPIEPAAGMQLSYFKEKYGKRICLKGNVDCAQTLTFGTVEDTIQETKECLRIGMPGYGYILSSSNSLHSEVKPDNYKALLDTLHEFGVYK
ncbi:uroporphyrinogen decarboxylase [Spirochaetia bacterium]|nr:uroporphyrinogen decarboxylase [Spirochaetia bacterium]